MSLNINQIVIRNFMSFGNNDTTIDFSQTGTFHILGTNLDTNSHNGAGKTTILNAVAYALYDRAISNISKDKLLNRTNKAKDTEMLVKLSFDVDGAVFTVSRTRGKTNSVTITKNGDDITPASIADCNDFIEELVGISFGLFKRTVVFSGSEGSFFEESAKVQREIIEELLRISVLTEKADILRADVSDMKKAIDIQAAVVDKEIQSKETWEKQVDQSETRIAEWDATQKTELGNCEAGVSQHSKTDFGAEDKIHTELDSISKNVNTKSAEYAACEQQLKMHTDRIATLGSEEAILETKIKSIDGVDFDAEQKAHEELTTVGNELMAVNTKFENESSLLGVRENSLPALIKEKETTEENIKLLNGIDFDVEQANIIKIDEIKVKLPEFNGIINTNKFKSVDAQKKRDDALAQLTHLADSTCPFCKQQFADADAKISELEGIVGDEDTKFTTATKLHDDAKAEQDNLNEQLRELQRTTQFDSTSIAEAKSQLEVLSKRATEFDKEIEACESDIKIYKISCAKLTEELGSMTSKVEEIHGKIKYDNLASLLETKSNIENHKTRLGAIYGEVDVTKVDIAKIETILSTLQAELGEGITKETELKGKSSFTSMVDVLKAKSSHDTAVKTLEGVKKSTNPHVDAMNELTKSGKPEVGHKVLDNMKEELEHQNFLMKLLTHKDSFVRKKIINRSIPYLNSRIQEYAADLGLPHSVHFNADMKVSISEHGRDLDYGNLSGGEQNRLNHALSWAFRDTRQYLLSKINILFTDEIDGGSVCPTGIADIIRLLKAKAFDDNIGIWVISHRPEMNNQFDHEITVVKEHGFSRIEIGE